MSKIRKFLLIGVVGVVLGVTMSVIAAPNAVGRSYFCDQRIEQMEKKAAKDYKKGKLTDAEYRKIQREIAFHRHLWGC